MTCEPANNWLQRARFANPRENGNRWNAAVLGKAFDSSAVEGAPAARFVHSFPLGGTAATTRANDPFWNMRVANSLMPRHDGYRLSSFICAMHQLVMDDITPVRASIVDRVSEPKPPLIRPRSSDQFGLGAQDSPDGQSKP